jgi:hypothetical protein
MGVETSISKRKLRRPGGDFSHLPPLTKPPITTRGSFPAPLTMREGASTSQPPISYPNVKKNLSFPTFDLGLSMDSS